MVETSGTAATGYSGTPLLKKLGVKRGQRALLVGVPEEVTALDRFADFGSCERVGDLASQELSACLAGGPFDYIHVFTKDAGLLECSLGRLSQSLADDGMIWVSWPKKASKVATDVSETVVRNLALAMDLVDVKVCAVDAIWSGLKLVIRKEYRGAGRKR